MYQLLAYQHCPGFDNSVLRHGGIWEAADEAVLNIIYKKKKIQKMQWQLCLWEGYLWVGMGLDPQKDVSIARAWGDWDL